MKTKTWIFLFAGIFIICTAISAVLYFDRAPARYVTVLSDGQMVAVLDLSKDTELTVDYQGGYNTVVVKDGKVSVQAASCPDQNCVLCGAKNSGIPIICLPNHLVLQFSEQGSIDGMTR